MLAELPELATIALIGNSLIQNIFCCHTHTALEWPDAIILRNEDWKFKIPYESVEVHSNFPIYGIAGMVKLYSPTSGEAVRGGIMFYHNCYAINGEI